MTEEELNRLISRKDPQNDIELARLIARKDPRLFAEVLRSWLNAG
jgi:flagellar biosynthesis/type III secretory pathway M-ring protein FliF/YscJ